MDERYMKEALVEAQKAYDKKEVPIGAVIVCGDKIVGRGHDTMETDKDSTCHAEISAIRNASKMLDRWRMTGCDLYVTTDPCKMCSGAIELARFDNVYVGTRDGILATQCAEIIRDFFRQLRKEDKESKHSEETK